MANEKFYNYDATELNKLLEKQMIHSSVAALKLWWCLYCWEFVEKTTGDWIILSVIHEDWIITHYVFSWSLWSSLLLPKDIDIYSPPCSFVCHWQLRGLWVRTPSECSCSRLQQPCASCTAKASSTGTSNPRTSSCPTPAAANPASVAYASK